MNGNKIINSLAYFASNEDIFEEESLEEDIPKVGIIPISTILDVEPECITVDKCNLCGVSSLSFELFVKKMEMLPSVVTLSRTRIKFLVRTLKKYGKTSLIYSSNYISGFPTSFILKVEDQRDPSMTMIVAVTDIRALPEEDYPEFSEDKSSYEGYCPQIPYSEDIRINYNPESKVIYQITKEINEQVFEVKDAAPAIEMIVSTNSGLDTRRINLDFNYESSDLELHYGDGFSNFHDSLVSRISNTNKGIIMFHGPPGTGKTHYVRRLIPIASKLGKRVILIPKHVMNSLESPVFNDFMLRNFVNQKILFIIEDSESIISRRPSAAVGGGRSELVSTLLNVTDGILNDILNIQVILTFNTDLKAIDEALLRKGRLIAKYSFEKLSSKQSKKLANHLGLGSIEDREHSLAEIYSLGKSEEDSILIEQNISPDITVSGF